MGDRGSVFERRTARLLRRAAFLRQRIADRGGGDRTARDVAEAVAIEWAVDLLVRRRIEALDPDPARSSRPPPRGAP